MDRVLLTTTARAAADWAERAAVLRGLPLCTGRAADADGARLVVADTGGPVPETVPRPVVLVPDGFSPTRRNDQVLLGVDARRPVGSAVGFAFGCARLHGLRLHAVHAWTLPAEAADLPFGIPEEDRGAWEDQEVQLLADVLRPWRARYPEVDVVEDVLLFPPAEALLHHRAHGALLVVGHRSAAPGWGHVVRTVVRESPCPVAVVPE
ncbi:universal stress protein [Streptomyces sp. NPDC026672]|uniref:universal stress protein n=1 Tax=unclassified Streptomyces TaxID=2593676 RepID=UPI0033DA119B